MSENQLEEDNNCDTCLNNNFAITTENKMLECPECHEQFHHTIWYSNCLICGLKEPLFTTKAEVIYLHHVAHERARMFDTFLNIQLKRCINDHNTSCFVIGGQNRFGKLKMYCCPCYNLTEHKKEHNPNFVFCKYCSLPAVR